MNGSLHHGGLYEAEAAMTCSYRFAERFRLTFSPETCRRIIAAKEVVLHCHHYNARLQHAIESVSQLNGKHIFTSVTEAVFAELIQNVLAESDPIDTRWQIATELYAYLGYGSMIPGDWRQDTIEADSSHYAEGWAVCFGEANRPVCSFTEGYIQAMVYAVTGEIVHARETACINQGAPRCTFSIDRTRRELFTRNTRHSFDFTPLSSGHFLKSAHVDERRIIDALVELPMVGNDEGLVPLFNVYLASTPAEFYNLVSIRFLEEMDKIHRLNSARRLMLFCAEICGLTTFRGIMHSPEWESLVAPMIRQDPDRLLAMIAVSNGLGWGNWHVLAHEPQVSVRLQALNGYEAIGYREYREQAATPQCLMFSGLSAGIMELLYGEGKIEERYGTFSCQELQCICCGADSCSFEAHRL